MKKIALLLLLSSNYLSSQTFDAIIKEINFEGNSYPTTIAKLDNIVIFSGENYKHDNDVYAFDLITNKRQLLLKNTKILKKIEKDNALYLFVVKDQKLELWKTTSSSSSAEKLVSFDASLQLISEVVYLNDNIYFIANNKSIYRYDISSKYYTLIKTFNNVLSSNLGLNGLTPFKNKIYFGASDTPVNTELWETDGSLEGTKMVKDINPTYSSINAFHALEMDGMLYFAASDANEKYGLWKTDGTAQGTTKVIEIPYFYKLQGVNYNNKIYFSAYAHLTGHDLWVTDGTEAGTKIVKNIGYNGNGGGFSSSDFIYIFNGQMYFEASSIESTASITEIWKSDGTELGTKKIAQIDDLLHEKDIHLSSGEKHIILRKENSGDTYILDKNDKVTKTNTNASSTDPTYIDIEPDKILMRMNDNSWYGVELYKYDMLTKEANIFTDINSYQSADPSTFLAKENGDIIFLANDPVNKYELNILKKGTDKPVLLKKLHPNPNLQQDITPGKFIDVGNFHYIKNTMSSNPVSEIIRTDGTAQNTATVRDSNTNISNNDLFTKLDDNTLLFTSNNYLPKAKLYKLANNSQTPEYITDVKFLSYYYNTIHPTITYNSKVYFIGLDDNFNRSVWQTDGTKEQTKEIISFSNINYPEQSLAILGVHNGKLLMSKEKEKNSGINSELWSYNISTKELKKRIYILL